MSRKNNKILNKINTNKLYNWVCGKKSPKILYYQPMARVDMSKNHGQNLQKCIDKLNRIKFLKIINGFPDPNVF